MYLHLSSLLFLDNQHFWQYEDAEKEEKNDTLHTTC
jgi:hypothetical protein